MPRIKLEKPDPITFLVKARYPRFFREDTIMGMSLSPEEHKKLKEEDENAQKYLEFLNSLPDEEVLAMQNASLSEAKKNIQMRLEAEEKAKPHNQERANADFEYWSKMPTWTLEEALALSFGKCPKIVTASYIKTLSQEAPFLGEFLKLKELAQRTLNSGAFSKNGLAFSHDPILPHRFVEWMQKNNLNFPDELAEKVLKNYDTNKPAKTLLERSLENLTNIPETTGPLAQRAETLLKANKQKPSHIEPKTTKAISNKEKSAYLNIIGALLGTLLGQSSSGKPYSQFRTQQAIIDSIHANYGEQHGLSKRNLETKFADARRNLHEPESK